jgi:hypothetical protein
MATQTYDDDAKFGLVGLVLFCLCAVFVLRLERAPSGDERERGDEGGGWSGLALGRARWRHRRQETSMLRNELDHELLRRGRRSFRPDRHSACASLL